MNRYATGHACQLFLRLTATGASRLGRPSDFGGKENRTPVRSYNLRVTRIRTAAAAIVLLAAAAAGHLPPLLADRREMSSPGAGPDLTTQLDRNYASLSPWLPETGRIGFRIPADWPSDDAARRFFLAEYSLTPRVILLTTAVEFVIVETPTAADVDRVVKLPVTDDAQLAGLTLYGRTSVGLQIARRVSP